MKKFIFRTSLFVLSILLFTNNITLAQDSLQKQSHKITHWMTPEEQLRKDEIGKDFYPTDPPTAPVRNIAEFEQMEGVLIRYPFGIPISLIADMSENVTVTTIVLNASQEGTVRNIYNSNGVNINNCDFLYAPTDTYWTRDYGPWFVVDSSNNVGIVNFPYNRPRPNDDDIPIKVADFLGIELYGMDLTHTGGNYMTDGMGASVSTELVWDENPSLTHEQIDQLVNDYLGITTYYVTPDPLGEYIKHVDCWGKFLGVDKIMIAKVAESDPRYNDFENIANYFANQISSYGDYYKVYRVYAPGDYPGTPYTNSLILNKKVYVPITGSQWDDEALASYQAAMTGYEIIGVEAGSDPWENTDALHCRTHGIADRGMLYIHHIPLLGEIPAQNEYEITANIISYCNAGIYSDSVKTYYKVNDGNYTSVTMNNTGGNTYTGIIPAQPDGSQVAYYIHAADNSGRSANHPYIGAPDPHIFIIQGSVNPDITLSTDSITFLTCGEPQLLTIKNNCSQDVNIDTIYFYDFWAYIDPPIPTLPYTLSPQDSLNLNIYFNCMVDFSEGDIVTADTLYVVSNENIHKVIIAADEDLFSIIKSNSYLSNIHLENSYPNPFSSSTNINFSIKEASDVSLEIYSVNGKKITSLINKKLEADNYSIKWDGKNQNGKTVSNGIYFYKLTSGKYSCTKKLLFVK